MKHLSTLLLLCILTGNLTYSQVRCLNGKAIEPASIDRFLQDQMDSLHIMGMTVAIVNDGRIVYHRALGTANIYTREKVTDQTTFECASMGKSVFAFFVMRLVEKKILSLDTPLYKYLPYPDIAYDNRYQLITARMVLDHTTGFPNWRNNDSLKILFTPGSKFSYSGEGYEYLARVIAQLTNFNARTLEKLFTSEVTAPLQLEHTHYSINPYIAQHLAAGHVGDTVVYEPGDKLSFHPAGGLYSDALDFARFLIAVMDRRLLTKESYDEMLKAQVELDSSKDAHQQLNRITSWGLGFSRETTPFGINYLHGGNNWGFTGQFLINMDKKTAYVFFTNTDQCNGMRKSMERLITTGP